MRNSVKPPELGSPEARRKTARIPGVSHPAGLLLRLFISQTFVVHTNTPPFLLMLLSFAKDLHLASCLSGSERLVEDENPSSDLIRLGDHEKTECQLTGSQQTLSSPREPQRF